MVGWHQRLNGHELEQTIQEVVEHRGAWHDAVNGVAEADTTE